MEFTLPANRQDVSAQRRKFPRSFLGDWLSDDWNRSHRRGLTLHDTMAKVTKRQSQRKGIISFNDKAQFCANDDAQMVHPTSTLEPEADAASGSDFGARTKKDAPIPGTRKITRRLLERLRGDPNAVLCINLNNIRKKLNWKANTPSDTTRPAKRVRLHTIPCIVYLSIWDNTQGQAGGEALCIKKQLCEISPDTREVDPVVGNFVKLELDRPFIVRKDELKVPVTRNGKPEYTMVQEYFLELKIIPRMSDSMWPPFPVLGKSDGDKFRQLDDVGKRKLQDSVVARYLTLTPEKDTPLSLFFYTDGTAYRTKYGLEIDAKWAMPDDLPTSVKREAEEDDSLVPWMFDDEDRPFGRRLSLEETSQLPKAAVRNAVASRNDIRGVPTKQRKQEESLVKTSPQAAGAKTRPTNASANAIEKVVSDSEGKGELPVVGAVKNARATARKSTVPRGRQKNGPKATKIKYTFDFGSARGLDKEFREADVKGFCCYSCADGRFKDLDQLMLHLDMIHCKYEHFVDETTIVDSVLTEAMIRIAEPGRKHQAQKSPTKGLTSPRKLDTVSVAATKHPLATLREQHRGFLPHEQVPPSRPKRYARRKYANIPLVTSSEIPSAPFTSISHRPIIVDDADEDARSETDDEMDDSWFVGRHLEELDVFARENKWSDAKRRLAKKWSYHVLGRERMPHSRYMSDCLLRFVRLEKDWILRRSEQWEAVDDHATLLDESMSALYQHMNELMQNRVINEATCESALAILAASDEDIILPDEEKEEVSKQQAEARSHRQHTHEQSQLLRRICNISLDEAPDSDSPLWDLPPNVCASCAHSIKRSSTHAVRCSSARCPFPGVYYHAKCAGLELRNAFNPSLVQDGSVNGTITGMSESFHKERKTWKCDRCCVVKAAAP